MHKTLIGLLMAASLSACSVVPTASSNEPPLPPGQAIALVNPSFNAGPKGELTGWVAIEHMQGESYTFEADRDKPHSPPTSARIRRHGAEFFGLLEQAVKVPPEWIGRNVRLSGYLRSAGATGTGGGLVLQARSGGSILAYDHMNGQRVRGDQGWKRYAITLKIPPGTASLHPGAMLEDDGTLWVDDLALELVD